MGAPPAVCSLRMRRDVQLRILVADDEEDILELLGEYLRARGYGVHSASDGVDALDIVRGGHVDVVLTDLNMPGMAGIELLAEIKRLPLPVATIVMTGFGTVESALQAMKEGAHDYLLKPFKLRDIHDAIVRAAERLAMERDMARMRELLSFYEMALSLRGPQDLPRIYGTVAAVALRDTEAEEVAVWMQGPSGWEAVARGGAIGALAALDPSEIASEQRGEAGVLAAPIRAHERRVGVLAVAGGQRGEADPERLQLFARVVGEAMERADTKQPPGKRTGGSTSS